MKVAILVPRREGFADRDRLWAFARRWWVKDFPDWVLVEGHHDEGPFNRSAAINAASDAAGDWDAAVIIDSDVLADPTAVRHAVDYAVATDAPALAYHERAMLTANGTEKVLRGFSGSWDRLAPKRIHDACSSAVVVSRPLWDAVGGFDEAFVGWGWEDVAFRCAVETMADKPLMKVASVIWHLHHTVSRENNRDQQTFHDNAARGALYRAARFDRPAMQRLLADRPTRRLPLPAVIAEPGGQTIPKILHRTIPAAPSRRADELWAGARALHPGWQAMTHQDPLDPGEWPETGELWDRCRSGAQKAGLIRLEAIWRWGGVYLDSDVEVYRPLDALCGLEGFAAWEDAKVVPDAMFGARPNHPVVRLMLDRAKASVEAGAGAWESGPGVFTASLPNRRDFLLLPPGSLYPYHYLTKARDARRDHRNEQPWAMAAHHWDASWVGNEA